jgi:hypothetical protein
MLSITTGKIDSIGGARNHAASKSGRIISSLQQRNCREISLFDQPLARLIKLWDGRATCGLQQRSNVPGHHWSMKLEALASEP